jgi:eukaryotic-like serine/threonine-protein kinase
MTPAGPSSGRGAHRFHTTGPLQISERFGTRYRIIRLLGSGGMGSVYQAWDTELDVAVAIKVIRPEAIEDAVAADDIERRFKRELLLARQVTHRNVVRIHDIGEIDGIKYITMPYVHGSDLATILVREGRMPLSRVLSIAKQVVAGLVAAHEAGVVHRDLKPANIMIYADDQALIMDFGVARATTGAGALDVTAAGAVVGTLAYMAPEQAKGGAVDQRADVYAFGLVMRDMLLGSRQGGPTTALAELMARMLDAPPPMRTLDATIPETLDALVTRCLQPDPVNRYERSADLLRDLDEMAESEQRERHAQVPTSRGEVAPAEPITSARKAADEEQKPVGKTRPLTRSLVAGVVVFALALAAGAWWLTRPRPQAAEHEPVFVVIADVRNATGDPMFDRTLEPMLKIALEESRFVTAFDRYGIHRGLGVALQDSLDERAAQEIAVSQGLNVVLSGTLVAQGGRYVLSLKATQALTGNAIAEIRGSALTKTQVLDVATSMAASVRRALGDDTAEPAPRAGGKPLLATALDVAWEYAAATEAMSTGKGADACQHFSNAIERDPNFGLGYVGMAIASVNLDHEQDAEKYIKEAIRHLDGMTERERYRTRGLYSYMTSDHQSCVKEFAALTAKYPGDVSAHNNLALCCSYVRDMPRAVDEMRKVVTLMPRRILYRENLAMYAAYSGDLRAFEEQAREFKNPGLYGLLATAFSQLLQGQLPQAAATYERLQKVGAWGASYTTSGLGDLALYGGRWSDAVALFTKGAAADLASKDAGRSADKLAALAYTQLQRGLKKEAATAAEQALRISNTSKIRFLAARVFLEADALPRARTLGASLASESAAEPRAYAKIVEGNIALKGADARQAARSIADANVLLDSWIGHFDLGRAYLEAGALPEAALEFERCIKRRGEALCLFLDEEPTYGYLPPVYYYQGRVREVLKDPAFAESYRVYLGMRGQSKEDPLLVEVRRRAGG